MPTTPTVAKAHPGTKHNIHDVTYVSGKQLALFQYLRTSSDFATQDTHLSTLSRKANLRKQAFQLIRQWVDAEAEARLIQMLREYRNAEVKVETAYPYLGLAASEQEANDFVAMVMDEIVGVEQRRAGGDSHSPEIGKSTAKTGPDNTEMNSGLENHAAGSCRPSGDAMKLRCPLPPRDIPAEMPTAPIPNRPGPLAARASKKRGAA